MPNMPPTNSPTDTPTTTDASNIFDYMAMNMHLVRTSRPSTGFQTAPYLYPENNTSSMAIRRDRMLFHMHQQQQQRAAQASFQPSSFHPWGSNAGSSIERSRNNEDGTSITANWSSTQGSQTYDMLTPEVPSFQWGLMRTSNTDSEERVSAFEQEVTALIQARRRTRERLERDSSTTGTTPWQRMSAMATTQQEGGLLEDALRPSDGRPSAQESQSPQLANVNTAAASQPPHLPPLRRHPRFSQRPLRALDYDAIFTAEELYDDSRDNMHPRIDSYRQTRRGFSEQGPEYGLPMTELAILYIERLRFSTSYEESFHFATVGGFAHSEFVGPKYNDLILDTALIDPPPRTSWLKIGSIFSGCQKANKEPMGSRAPEPVSRVRAGMSMREEVTHPHMRADVSDAPPSLILPPPPDLCSEDSWPVRVTIHDIDYKNMTLSGTMEAYSIPDKYSPTFTTSITTYLEGEIIDFRNFSLATKSFKANAKIDSHYWQKLQPFKQMSDDQIAASLVSKKWVTEELMKKWILMRWKEKCFITPSSHRSGLTISGFYYISLNRESGEVEGLYYDPGSSPFQRLELMPCPEMRATWGSWQFR